VRCRGKEPYELKIGKTAEPDPRQRTGCQAISDSEYRDCSAKARREGNGKGGKRERAKVVNVENRAHPVIC